MALKYRFGIMLGRQLVNVKSQVCKQNQLWNTTNDECMKKKKKNCTGIDLRIFNWKSQFQKYKANPGKRVLTAHWVGYCGLLTMAINNYYSTYIDFTSSKFISESLIIPWDQVKQNTFELYWVMVQCSHFLDHAGWKPKWLRLSISQYVPLLIWVSKLTQNILDIWNLHMHVRISHYKWSIYFNNNVQHCKKNTQIKWQLNTFSTKQEKIRNATKKRDRERFGNTQNRKDLNWNGTLFSAKIMVLVRLVFKKTKNWKEAIYDCK